MKRAGRTLPRDSAPRIVASAAAGDLLIPGSDVEGAVSLSVLDAATLTTAVGFVSAWGAADGTSFSQSGADALKPTSGGADPWPVTFAAGRYLTAALGALDFVHHNAGSTVVCVAQDTAAPTWQYILGTHGSTAEPGFQLRLLSGGTPYFSIASGGGSAQHSGPVAAAGAFVVIARSGGGQIWVRTNGVNGSKVAAPVLTSNPAAARAPALSSHPATLGTEGFVGPIGAVACIPGAYSDAECEDVETWAADQGFTS